MTRTDSPSDGPSVGFAGQSPQAESDSGILLICSAGRQDRLCKALAGALAEVWPGPAVTVCTDEGAVPLAPAALTIRYHAQHRAADWLAEYLSWQGADGSSGRGPVIEHSVLDGFLTAESLSGFARALVRHSGIPQQML